MLNNVGVHDLDDTFMILEVHLMSDLTTVVASVPLPSTVINFRLLGHPSSYFYQIPPRYTRFAIATHFASFFNVFYQYTWLRVHERMRYSHSLPTSSALPTFQLCGIMLLMQVPRAFSALSQHAI
jgi:hypothetical protein